MPPSPAMRHSFRLLYKAKEASDLNTVHVLFCFSLAFENERTRWLEHGSLFCIEKKRPFRERCGLPKAVAVMQVNVHRIVA